MRETPRTDYRWLRKYPQTAAAVRLAKDVLEDRDVYVGDSHFLKNDTKGAEVKDNQGKRSRLYLCGHSYPSFRLGQYCEKRG